MNIQSTFLIQKSVFLLNPSVGKDMAYNLINRAIEQIGVISSDLTEDDIVPLAARLEPALRPLVGNDKAQRLASALRVLVGGVPGTIVK